MPTHRDVQRIVKARHGFQPKPCWIADVKEMSGLPVRRAWNRQGRTRKNPCPGTKIEAIQQAMKELGMIS